MRRYANPNAQMIRIINANTLSPVFGHWTHVDPNDAYPSAHTVQMGPVYPFAQSEEEELLLPGHAATPAGQESTLDVALDARQYPGWILTILSPGHNIPTTQGEQTRVCGFGKYDAEHTHALADELPVL